MSSVSDRVPVLEDAGRAFAVSLVVPMRNEVASLAALVGSIRAQTRPPDEVILVDGGSTDGTPALARELAGEDARFRIIEAGEATPGRGRNIGSAAARCEWIAYTDAGIRLEPTWLERLARAASAEVDIVYGHYEPVRRNWFEECAALAYVPPKRQRGDGWMRGPSIASCLVRRAAWEAVGGFPDLRAAEDLVFMERIETAGFRIAWAPDATVHWQLQPNLRRTFRRFVLYSCHNVWAGRQRYWHYGLARQYLLAAPFLVLAAAQHPLWAAIPVGGFLARTARSIWQRREGRSPMWVLQPQRMLGVALVLGTLDAATFLGWAQAVLRRSPSRGAGELDYQPVRQ